MKTRWNFQWLKLILSVSFVFSWQVAYGYSFRGTEMLDLSPGHSEVDWSKQKSPIIARYISRSIKEYDKAIESDDKILIGKIKLGISRIIFFENPKDSISSFGSTILVIDKGHPKIFHIDKMLKDNSLSLGYAAIIRYGIHDVMLICNYVGQPSEGPEAFVILHFSSSGFSLHTLPLTTFGKVVIFKENPRQVEIWSALQNDVSVAAAPTLYSSQSCLRESRGYKCGPRVRQAKIFAPNSIIDPGIEIR